MIKEYCTRFFSINSLTNNILAFTYSYMKLQLSLSGFFISTLFGAALMIYFFILVRFDIQYVNTTPILEPWFAKI